MLRLTAVWGSGVMVYCSHKGPTQIKIETRYHMHKPMCSISCKLSNAGMSQEKKWRDKKYIKPVHGQFSSFNKFGMLMHTLSQCC